MKLIEELASLIEQHGLTAVVESLSAACTMKSVHAPDDTPERDSWVRVASRLSDLAYYIRPFAFFTK